MTALWWAGDNLALRLVSKAANSPPIIVRARVPGISGVGIEVSEPELERLFKRFDTVREVYAHTWEGKWGPSDCLWQGTSHPTQDSVCVCQLRLKIPYCPSGGQFNCPPAHHNCSVVNARVAPPPPLCLCMCSGQEWLHIVQGV